MGREWGLLALVALGSTAQAQKADINLGNGQTMITLSQMSEAFEGIGRPNNERWWPIGRSGFEIDLMTTSHVGSVWRVWLRHAVNGEFKTMPTAAFVTMREEHDCDRSSSTTMEAITYDKAGKVLFRSSTPGQPERVTPDTNIEFVHRFVCN
ncbi:surface-adhesin E family protein [Xanthomonas sp. NCPPB 1062]|uniref:surface-adhesin E family protein n=1 Tax=Xanthomonas sp. NCPPB 1062 TaxID=487523 RepID=UPI0035569A79